jgi:hypothetical protein
MSMEKSLVLGTGLEIPDLECLVVIRIGEDLSGSLSTCS